VVKNFISPGWSSRGSLQYEMDCIKCNKYFVPSTCDECWRKYWRPVGNV